VIAHLLSASENLTFISRIRLLSVLRIFLFNRSLRPISYLRGNIFKAPGGARYDAKSARGQIPGPKPGKPVDAADHAMAARAP
jgi:hypothetical protein